MTATIPAQFEQHRPALVGAGLALGVGLLLGAGLKAEIDPTSSYGQQIQVSQPAAQARTAFDDWFPAEGAPPPAYQAADLTTGDDIQGEVERQIERLLRFGAGEPASMIEDVEPGRPAPKIQVARQEPATDDAYAAPPAAPPDWGWAPPQAYPDPTDEAPVARDDWGAVG